MSVHPDSDPIIDAMIYSNVDSEGRVRQSFFCGQFTGPTIEGLYRPEKELYIIYFQSPIFSYMDFGKQIENAVLSLLEILDLNGVDIENEMIPCGVFPDMKRASEEDFTNHGIRYTLFFIAAIFLDEDDEMMIPEDFLRDA